ncbi:hypothetical protein N8710_01250 [Planktomarina temperata]|nr:hypothetical protein [Planktomarina temperata]
MYVQSASRFSNKNLDNFKIPLGSAICVANLISERQRHAGTFGEYNMLKPWVIGIISLGALIGCMREQEVYVTGPAKVKSIMVPAGLSSPAKQIKSVFREANWQTFVAGRTAQTSGVGGQHVNLNTRVKYPGRYSLFADWSKWDFCLSSSKSIYDYNITVVDNNSGEEVLALTGRETCGPGQDLASHLKSTMAGFL